MWGGGRIGKKVNRKCRMQNEKCKMQVELEEAPGDFRVVKDRRPVIPVPPPVSLVAAEDVRLAATVGLERELVGFSVQLLQLERDERQGGLVLRAGNVRSRLAW